MLKTDIANSLFTTERYEANTAAIAIDAVENNGTDDAGFLSPITAFIVATLQTEHTADVMSERLTEAFGELEKALEALQSFTI